MTPGPTLYYECLSCEKTIELHTIYSGNNFRARYWTDGYMLAPMLPDFLSFGKCPHCKNLFWTKDLKYLGEVDWLFGENGPEKAWGKTKAALEFETTDYLYAIETSFAMNKEDEKLIRTHAWWKFNDVHRRRHRKRSFFKKADPNNINEKLFSYNLSALENMLDENIQSERLMKAEIARELGKFEECKSLLNFEFDERLNDAKEFIQKCNDEKISVVADMTDWFKEKTTKAQELYSALKDKYIKEGINYIKTQAIARGIATEENFLSVLHNLTIKEFLELRGSYKELYTIHFPKPK